MEIEVARGDRIPQRKGARRPERPACRHQPRFRGRSRFTAVFALSAALFGVSAVGGFVLAQRLHFNALAVIWEPGQLLYVVAYYLLFGVPFFCAATCVGLAFAAFPNQIARVYRYDMVGAGLGALGIIVTLFWLFPSQALRMVGALGLLAAALASRQCRSAAYLVGAALVYPNSHLLDSPALLRVQGAHSSTPHSWNRGRARGVIAPLAFCMGMPFPLALSRVSACAYTGLTFPVLFVRVDGRE